MTEEFIERYKQAKRLATGSEMVDGMEVFYDEDGSPLLAVKDKGDGEFIFDFITAVYEAKGGEIRCVMK